MVTRHTMMLTVQNLPNKLEKIVRRAQQPMPVYIPRTNVKIF